MEVNPYRITRITFSYVSCYLVHHDGGALLVDTGKSDCTGRILKTVGDVGLTPGDLKMIIITHGHFDHAGSAREIQELTGVPVAVHRNDCSYVEKGLSPIPDGTRWKAKLLVGLGRIITRRIGRFPALEPDIIIDDELELCDYGFNGKIIHTPGHTTGSLVVVMDDGNVLAGDTIFGLKDKELFPPFAEDTRLLLASWERLIELPAKWFYPAHGRKISIKELKEEYPAALSKYIKKQINS